MYDAENSPMMGGSTGYNTLRLEENARCFAARSIDKQFSARPEKSAGWLVLANDFCSTVTFCRRGYCV